MTPSGSISSSQFHRHSGPDDPGDTAGDQLAQHGVQTAHHLGPTSVEITMTFRPQLHHGLMILDRDGPHRR
jgi:hypothetical protein